MRTAHILRTPNVKRPFWRTDERFPDSANQKVWTDCCGCKQPASETLSRIVETFEMPLGGCGGEANGIGKFVERPIDDWAGVYYDPTVETVCAEGFGCTVNPRKKCGRTLREYWRWG